MSRQVLAAVVVCQVFVRLAGAADDHIIKLQGYAEMRHGEVLVVDGQRIVAGPGLKLKGTGSATGFEAIPLGYEVKVKGVRDSYGAVVAREIEAKPNGLAFFEQELNTTFDEIESQWRRRGEVYDDTDGYHVLGKLHESGPDVERVRRLAEPLVPAYRKPSDFRFYVVENREWNAMAAPNGSIYIFSGLLAEMDDDEVAFILGHELAHATHEHSRKTFKKSLWIQMALAGGLAVAGAKMEPGAKRTIVEVLAVVGAVAWGNHYSRNEEDQADRVGLRYAFEGGYDVRKGPALWHRFAEKYGNSNKVVNFLFGSHSACLARARNLEREIEVNYLPR